MTIKLKLNELLEARGMSTRDLVSKTGLAYNTVLGLRRGNVAKIGFDTLDRLCEALRVTPSDVLEFTPRLSENVPAAGRRRHK